jgi:hypothetical protein
MRNVLPAIVVAVTGCIPAYTQSLSFYDPVSLGLAGTVVAYEGENYIRYNPAQLGRISGNQLGIGCYTPWMLPALNTYSVSGTWCPERGTIAGGLLYFGTGMYNETRSILAFGKNLSSWLTGGIGLNYCLIREEINKQYTSRISGDLGFLLKATGNLWAGVLCMGITDRTMEIESPQRIAFGIAWAEEKDHYFSVQLDLEDLRQVSLGLALEYWFAEQFVLRIGNRMGYGSCYSLGFGVNYRNAAINFGFNHHYCLGFSSGIGLTYNFR